MLKQLSQPSSSASKAVTIYYIFVRMEDGRLFCFSEPILRNASEVYEIYKSQNPMALVVRADISEDVFGDSFTIIARTPAHLADIDPEVLLSEAMLCGEIVK